MCVFPGFCLITQVKADVPHGARAGAAVPVSPPVTRRHGDGDGASFRLGATLSVGLSRAEAANYTALSDRVLVKENTARGSSFPPFFFVCGCFFLDVFNDFAKEP